MKLDLIKREYSNRIIRLMGKHSREWKDSHEAMLNFELDLEIELELLFKKGVSHGLTENKGGFVRGFEEGYKHGAKYLFSNN